MEQNRKKKFHLFLGYGVFALLFLIAEACQEINGPFEDITCFIAVVILFLLISVFIFSIFHRIIKKDLKIYLLIITFLLLFWILLRFFKYWFTESMTFENRILWYLYYIPLCIIPPTFFVLASSLQPKHEKTIWYILLSYLPGLILCILVLTNDLHSLAFSFHPNGYQHEIVYYLVVGWIFLTLLSAVIILFITCPIQKSKKLSWIPFSVIIIGGVFILFNFFYNDFFKSPDTITFVCITLLESLIEVGLIPSNKNYKDYFEVSNLNAFLTDVNGKVIYRSKGAIEISESQKTKGKVQPVFLDENIRLSSKKLHGGYIYWFEDLKEINTINRELNEVNMQLEDENDLLEEENDIRQKEATLREQKRLYDSLFEQVKDKLERLKEKLESPADVEKTLRTCSFEVACIKRRENLLLLCEKEEKLSSQELSYSIKEILDYLTLAYIPCSFVDRGSCRLQAKDLFALYCSIEEGLESCQDSLLGCLVQTEYRDHVFSLRIALEGAEFSLKETESIIVSKEKEENMVYYILSVKGEDL